MRAMSADESHVAMHPVAPQPNDDEVVVTGYPTYYFDGSDGSFGPGPPPGGASQPYGTGDQEPLTGPDVYVPPHKCTDAEAIAIANQIAAQSQSNNYEFEAGIWKSPDGNIHLTPLVTSHSSTTVGINEFENVTMPVGSVILGTVHNHDIAGLGGPYPSSASNTMNQGSDDLSEFNYFASYNNTNAGAGTGGSYHEYIVYGATGDVYDYDANNIIAGTQGTLGHLVDPKSACGT